MNEVYLNGVIADMKEMKHRTVDTRHLEIQLRLSHRNRRQQMIHELYPVNAWDRLAAWAADELRCGMRVTVKGYLTQRSNDGGQAVEITAQRFLVNQMKPEPMDAPGQPEK